MPQDLRLRTLNEVIMILKARSEGDRIENDFSWLIKNTSLFQDKYCGKWIAIVNEEIISIFEIYFRNLNKDTCFVKTAKD